MKTLGICDKRIELIVQILQKSSPEFIAEVLFILQRKGLKETERLQREGKNLDFPDLADNENTKQYIRETEKLEYKTKQKLENCIDVLIIHHHYLDDDVIRYLQAAKEYLNKEICELERRLYYYQQENSEAEEEIAEIDKPESPEPVEGEEEGGVL